MGMDVCGIENSEAYFRNSIWFWGPLADYCAIVAPALWGKIEYPQSNDGSGLNTVDSKALAVVLRAAIASGDTARYAEGYKRNMEAMYDETCDLCAGTGQRTDLTVPMGCNKCRGEGKVRPFDTRYPFRVDNVEKFATFLETCGGFQIR